MRYPSLFPAFVFSALIAVTLIMVITRSNPTVQPPMQPAMTAAPVQASMPQTPPPARMTILRDQVPENQELYVTWSQIVALNQEKRPEQISYSTVQDSSHFGTPQWTLIRFRDGFYVRGYRVYNAKDADSDWFSSTKMAGYDDCRSETVPLSDLKALSGPPEMTDGEKDNIETVLLPEKNP